MIATMSLFASRPQVILDIGGFYNKHSKHKIEYNYLGYIKHLNYPREYLSIYHTRKHWSKLPSKRSGHPAEGCLSNAGTTTPTWVEHSHVDQHHHWAR